MTELEAFGDDTDPAEEADFAEEHATTTFADQLPGGPEGVEEPESPEGVGGEGGMDMDRTA